MMRIKRLLLNGICLAILLFVWPMLSLAGVINLPQTGQTTCYDESDIIISCTGTGQDGDVQAGVPWPELRFVDNVDGTITDRLTGLIWLKDANCFGIRSWFDARSDSNSLASETCGLTDGSLAGDWRLPNVVELESLMNIGVSDSASWLISQGFTSVRTRYWSADWAYSAWMNPGAVGGSSGGGLENVWPVRGKKVITDANVDVPPAKTWHTGQAGHAGVAWPEPRFVDNGDGTITDRLTGLIWLQHANCFGIRNWAEALSVSNSLASGTCGLSDGSLAGDWRLPNRKELFSLIDFSRSSPALATGHPFVNVLTSHYWSASSITPRSKSSGKAWRVNMSSGGMGPSYASRKDTSNAVWPVRDGDGGIGDNGGNGGDGTGDGGGDDNGDGGADGGGDHTDNGGGVDTGDGGGSGGGGGCFISAVFSI